MRNFIFDVDRTLVDSYIVELNTLRQSLMIVTGQEFDNKVMDKLTMLTTDEFFNEIGIRDNHNVMIEVNRNWARLLKETKIKLFNGIKEQLIILKENGCFLGIATSRNKEELDELEELLEVLPLFDCIITSDRVSKPKPDPESINIILEKYNLNLNETIYIGDSVCDSIASLAAGVKFGNACWDNKDILMEYNYLLNNTSDITDLILLEKK